MLLGRPFTGLRLKLLFVGIGLLPVLTGLLLMLLLSGLPLTLLLPGLLLWLLSRARSWLLLGRLCKGGLLLIDLLGLTLRLLLRLLPGLILILLLIERLGLMLRLLDLLGLSSLGRCLSTFLSDFASVMPLLRTSPFSFEMLASTPEGLLSAIFSSLLSKFAVVSFSKANGDCPTSIILLLAFRDSPLRLCLSSSELLPLESSVPASVSLSEILFNLRLDFLSRLLRLFSRLRSLFLFPCLYLSFFEYFFFLLRLSSLELLISDDDDDVDESESLSVSEDSVSDSDELSDSEV